MLKRCSAAALSLLLIVTLLPACSEGSVLKWSKEASTQVSEAFATAPTAVDAFVARGVITEEQGETLKLSFAHSADSYTPLDQRLQSLTRLDASAALEILPFAEAFVKRLADEKLIKLPDNPEVAKWYATARAILDVFGARLVARLKSKASGASQSFFELRREKQETEDDLKRLRTLFAA